MHPTPYPTSTIVLVSLLWTGNLEDIPTGIPHIATGATHLDTYHTGATSNTTPMIAAGLAPGTPQELPIDHTQERY